MKYSSKIINTKVGFDQSNTILSVYHNLVTLKYLLMAYKKNREIEILHKIISNVKMMMVGGGCIVRYCNVKF